MIDNVVPMPTEAKKVWICQCGCSTFYLVGDGATECAACDTVVSGDQGGWNPPATDTRWDGPEPFADVQGNGSEEFARRRISTLAQQSDVVALVVVRECGTVHARSSVESEEQISWVERRLSEAADLIAKKYGFAEDD